MNFVHYFTILWKCCRNINRVAMCWITNNSPWKFQRYTFLLKEKLLLCWNL